MDIEQGRARPEFVKLFLLASLMQASGPAHLKIFYADSRFFAGIRLKNA